MFQDFQDGGSAPASEDVRSFTVLLSDVYSQRQSSACVVSFETTGDLETSTFLRWFLICCCVVFVNL